MKLLSLMHTSPSLSLLLKCILYPLAPMTRLMAFPQSVLCSVSGKYDFQPGYKLSDPFYLEVCLFFSYNNSPLEAIFQPTTFSESWVLHKCEWKKKSQSTLIYYITDLLLKKIVCNCRKKYLDENLIQFWSLKSSFLIKKNETMEWLLQH